MPTFRENYFHQLPGDNFNVHPVIARSSPPTSSIGWSQHDFFTDLGNPAYPLYTIERKTEQLYLLKSMSKGAMYEAASIAHKYQVCIAVRPTGLLAHPGIESGDPTKAQEFKNKTSKEQDLFLCDELRYEDLGAVVHYDPRAGWHSSQPISRSASLFTQTMGKTKVLLNPFSWRRKREHIQTVRLPQLVSLLNRNAIKFWPNNEADWEKLHELFEKRAYEYAEEDYEYRYGHYARHANMVHLCALRYSIA